MAVTSGGSPYVEASDLVADYPATSLALANKVDTKLDNAPTDNAQSGATYTFVLGDARNITTATNASAKTFTIPPQASVTWLTGTMIRVVNYGAGALTVNGGVGVTVTNTASTIAQYGAATAIRTGSNAWTLVPFSGGAGNANFSDTATGTYTDSGINYKYLSLLSTGTFTISTAGSADLLVIAGGGGGGRSSGGGGGAGGYFQNNVYLPTGTYTCTIGAGGAAGGGTGTNGSNTSIKILTVADGKFACIGGGGGGSDTATRAGSAGGSGGGGSDNTAGGTGAQSGNGGTPAAGWGAGGGGASADGNANGFGGAGFSSSITGAAVGRGGGGGGRGSTGGTATDGGGTGGVTATAGTANTGGGGGGSAAANPAGAGGSGIVILRVKV
jgi:hypothetical protein